MNENRTFRMSIWYIFQPASMLIFPVVKFVIDYLTTTITVTDNEVIFKRGLLNIKKKNFPLKRIESVQVDQNVIGLLLNFGTVHVTGSGLAGGKVKCIASPNDLNDEINERKANNGD